MQHEELLQEVVELKALYTYINKSEELRNFKNRYKLKNAILSKVLIKTLTENENTIIVNKGSRHGIKKDMVAIYKFQLVGRVSQVFPSYSKIILITDKRNKVAAYTNENDSRGIVEGTNTPHKCQLSYISHLKQIKNGDYVLSSGQGLLFPEGFCLGKIINIQTQDLCHTVELEPLINLKNLEMCHLTNQNKMDLF